MNPRLKSLSSLAAAYLAVAPSAEAQYVDLVPDVSIDFDTTIVMPYQVIHKGEHLLDVNADGVYDFKFYAGWTNGCSSSGLDCGSDMRLNATPLNSNKFRRGVGGSPHEVAMKICSTIGSTSTSDYGFLPGLAKLYHRSISDPWTGSFWSFTETYGWGEPDTYLGFQLEVGGQTHYGWIRFSYSIESYFFNPIPDSSVVAGVHPTAPTRISDFEVDEVSGVANPERILVSFDLADCAHELDIGEYRVYVDKPPYLSVADLIVNSNFQSVSPGASPYSLTLDPVLKDTDGDSIESIIDYRIHLLANSGILPVNESAHYRYQNIMLDSVPLLLPLVKDAQLFDLGNSMNASDLRLRFSVPSSEAGILHYEVLLVRESTTWIMSPDYAEPLSTKLIVPVGADFDAYFSSSFLHFNSGPLLPGIEYRAAVITRADPAATDFQSSMIFSNKVKFELAPYPGLPSDDGDDDDIW